MSFYVLENTEHNYMKIHRGACLSCNYGKGPRQDHTGKWSKEFTSFQQALEWAQSINRPLANHCKRCHPQQPD